jgi:hypothetical protein
VNEEALAHWGGCRVKLKKIKSPDDDWQLEPKHVVLNKMIKILLCVIDLKHVLVIPYHNLE